MHMGMTLVSGPLGGHHTDFSQVFWRVFWWTLFSLAFEGKPRSESNRGPIPGKCQAVPRAVASDGGPHQQVQHRTARLSFRIFSTGRQRTGLPKFPPKTSPPPRDTHLSRAKKVMFKIAKKGNIGTPEEGWAERLGTCSPEESKRTSKEMACKGRLVSFG